jgi:hypothetical protein
MRSPEQELGVDPRAWPPSVPLWPTLRLAVPIGRQRAYEMASRDELPFVRRLGTRYLIISAQLCEWLSLGPPGREAGSSPDPAVAPTVTRPPA